MSSVVLVEVVRVLYRQRGLGKRLQAAAKQPPVLFPHTGKFTFAPLFRGVLLVFPYLIGKVSGGQSPRVRGHQKLGSFYLLANYLASLSRHLLIYIYRIIYPFLGY